MICIYARHREARVCALFLFALSLGILSGCKTVDQVKSLVSGSAIWMHVDGATSLNVNTCSQSNSVSLLDGSGNSTTSDQDVIFSMKGPVTYFSDSECTQLQDKFTLPAGQNSIQVYFIANVQGQKQLQAASSQIALDSNILEVDVMLNAVLSVQENPALGTWPVNKTSTFNFVLYNAGSLTATLKSAPTTTSPFAVQAGSCTGTLTAGNTCKFTITFSPTAEGNYSEPIAFAINDGVEDTTYNLTVTASTPNASGSGGGQNSGGGGGGGGSGGGGWGCSGNCGSLSVGGGSGNSLTSGTLDITFHSTGSVVTTLSATGGANAVVVQPDGKIVVAGEQGLSAILIRYNTDGSLDSTFGTAGIATLSITGASARANALALQSNGSIVVAGSANGILVARFTSSGVLDTTFGTAGSVVDAVGAYGGLATAVAVQSDGKIVVGGHDYVDFRVLRYNTNGTPDTAFGNAGMVTTDLNSGSVDQASGIAIQSDGRIVQVGTSWGTGYNGAFAIVRYNTDGSLDTTFKQTGKALYALGAGAPAVARAVALQSDGKIVIVGDQNYQLAIGRLNTDGSGDSSFGTGGEVLLASNGQDFGNAVIIQADGKILIAGSSRDPNSGLSSIILVRTLATGAPDTAFATNAEAIASLAASSLGHGVAVQLDGKIAVVGDSGGAAAVLRYLP